MFAVAVDLPESRIPSPTTARVVPRRSSKDISTARKLRRCPSGTTNVEFLVRPFDADDASGEVVRPCRHLRVPLR